MGRQRSKRNYIDLRSRWLDNRKLVSQILEDARANRDWTIRIKDFIMDGAESAAPKSHKYRNIPDLREMSLDEEDLSQVKFRGAALIGATGYRCTAKQLEVLSSNAERSKWCGSQLIDSSFMGSNLKGADFSGCDLSNVNFSECDLRRADFRHSRLNRSAFRNTDLRFANLTNVTCQAAEFSNAKLFGASLWQLNYSTLRSESLDISPEGDGSVLTNDLRLAPIAHLLCDDKLADIVQTMKLKTVVVLGKDSSSDDLALLKRIADLAGQRGLIPVLVKEQREIHGEPFFKKALMYSLLARFVIVENSSASGHIVELPTALSNGCVVAVLQRVGRGATWLLEEEFFKYRTVERFFYQTDSDFEYKCSQALDWCEKTTDDLGQRYRSAYEALKLEYIAPISTSRN